MKKFLALLLVVAILFAVGCAAKKYQVEVEGRHKLASEIKDSYAAGEEIKLQLETVTGHYYVVSVNGEKQEMDREASDAEYTYYTFTMPEEDILIKIESKWADMQDAPED